MDMTKIIIIVIIISNSNSNSNSDSEDLKDNETVESTRKYIRNYTTYTTNSLASAENKQEAVENHKRKDDNKSTYTKKDKPFKTTKTSPSIKTGSYSDYNYI